MFSSERLGDRHSFMDVLKILANLLSLDLFPLLSQLTHLHVPFIISIKGINISGSPQSLPPFSALPHQRHNRSKRQHTTKDCKHEESPLIPNLVAKVYHIESISHSEFLSDKVEQLRSFRGLWFVAINAISVASGRNDLQAKASKPHSKKGSKPKYVVLKGKAVDQ